MRWPCVSSNGSDAMNDSTIGGEEGQDDALLAGRIVALHANPELDGEELVEGEPPPRLLLRILGAGIVVLLDGIAEHQQGYVLAHGVRQRVRYARAHSPVLRAVQRVAHDLTHLARRYTPVLRRGSRRIERHQPRRVQTGSVGAPDQLPLRRLHLLLTLEDAHLAAEDDPGHAAGRVGRAGDGSLELLSDPRVAPPDHTDVAGVVADYGLCSTDASAAAQTHLVRLPEHGLHGLLLSHAQFGDSGPFPAVDVAQREEVEQVAHGGVRGREHAPPDEHPPDRGSLRAVHGPQRAQGLVERVASLSRGDGWRLGRWSGAPVGAGGWPVAEEAAGLVRPALALARVEFGIGDGEEPAFVQRSQHRVSTCLCPQRFEEPVEPAGDGPVGEAVSRLNVQDVPEGPHL